MTAILPEEKAVYEQMQATIDNMQMVLDDTARERDRWKEMHGVLCNVEIALTARVKELENDMANYLREDGQTLSRYKARIKELEGALEKIGRMTVMTDHKRNTATLIAANDVARAALKGDKA
jgi:hypothetical protein